MEPWIIVLLAIWIYPILGAGIVSLSIRLKRLKEVNVILSSIVLFVSLGLIFKLSFASLQLDWLVLTCYYLWVCTALFSLIKLKVGIVRFLIRLTMVGVFGFGYLLGSFGILGLAWTVDEYVPRNEISISEGLYVKETGLGSAVSDYRGVRVEIFEETFIPFLERRKASETFMNFYPLIYGIAYEFESESKKLILKLKDPKHPVDKNSWVKEISLK